MSETKAEPAIAGARRAPAAELRPEVDEAFERVHERPSERRDVRPSILATVVACASMLAFASAIGGDFIYDDHALIPGNGWVHSFAGWKHWFTSDFWDVSEELKRFGGRILYWRPLVLASYALDWKVGGGSTVAFHVTNLLWSGLVGWLAFRALHRWSGAARPAFVGALLFALHPTKAESVAWIAGRTDVLCAAALLLVSEAVAARLRARKAGSTRGVAIAIAFEVVATAVAYATKEQSIVLAAFVAIEAWVALGRPAIDGRVAKRLVVAGAPQLGIAIVYLAIRTRVLPFHPKSGAMPASMRVLEVLETFGRYVRSIVWPFGLTVQQGLIHSAHGRLVFHYGYVALGVAFLVALVGGAILARKRAPMVTLGLAFFLGTILPTSNVVPTGMMTMVADRFLYLPMLGLALAFVGGVLLLSEPLRVRALVVAGGVAAVLGVATVARSDDFSDEREFWAREYAIHPDSLEALRYRIDVASRDRRFHEALALTAQAQQIASQNYGHTGYEADFVIYGARFLAMLTPDRDAARLRGISSFCAQATDPNATVARLALPDIELSLPLGKGAIGGRVTMLRARFEMLHADLESRLGDDETAVRIAAAGDADCPGCAETAQARALIEARAGHFDRAGAVLDAIARDLGEVAIADTRAIVRKAELQARQAELAPEGPLQLDLRATELATLEAWGRAYAVLAPYQALIKRAPGMAYGFAELAFRAGHPDVARDVLGVVVPPEKIEPTERKWARRMGWIDEGPLDLGTSSPATP